MSRRDTIIIAVLINAGLLVVLFSTALKSNKSDEIAAAPVEKIVPQHTEIAVNKEPAMSAAPKDEVDHVLHQFSQPVSDNSNSTTQEVPLLATENTIETKNDFIQDLNGITGQVQGSLEQPVNEVANAPRAVEVVVKKGDVLEKIARSNRTTVEEIMRLNHLSSTRLKIGQVLKVTAGSSSEKKSADRSDTPTKYYVVKNGDNPWTIAVKNHMKVEELLKLNNLDKEKARHLKPGDKLKIKG